MPLPILACIGASIRRFHSQLAWHQDAKLMCVTLSAATATDARGTSICVGDYKLPLQWDLTIHSECALWVHRLMPGPDGLRRGKGEITRLCGIVPNGARFLNVGTVDGEPQRVCQNTHE